MSEASELRELVEKLDQLVDRLQNDGQDDADCELIGEAIAELSASTRVAMQILPAWLLLRRGTLIIGAEPDLQSLRIAYAEDDSRKENETWSTELHIAAAKINTNGDVLAQALHATMARATTNNPQPDARP